MPERKLQANLSLAELSGEPVRSVPPQGQGNSPSVTPWANTLTSISRQNERLSQFICRTRPRAVPVLRQMERERSRLARELHSGAGQSLAGIKLNLEMLAKSQDILSAPARKIMDRLERLTEQALQQVRSVSHSLHPPDWQGLSLYTALRALVETSGLAERVAVEFIVSEFPVEPVHDIKIAIYRCAQECIANIIKHSAATRVSFRVELEGPFIVMRIRDNGCGFEVENPFSDKLNRGIGLIALKEYAEVADGILDVKSDSAGTTVVLSVALLSTVTMEE